MRLKEKKGFSLVEVVIGTGILAFVLVGILGTYIACLLLITSSKNVNAATNAAQGIIEEIRSTPFTQIISNYNGMVFTVDDLPSSIGVVYISNSTPPANADLLLATVSICWRQGNKVIGEDVNLNGVLDTGEDINGNGIIDSTVQLKTLVVRG
ncbi:MAG: prepilin-type N-terminal cleavage/methylation domain-containing protein [Candidatus Omnitrophica bacterium]|nr:prepilin-type N-terminal cleavage/methylation domain-containing protein [Candidatus Omnitrophota bacterium]